LDASDFWFQASKNAASFFSSQFKLFSEQKTFEKYHNYNASGLIMHCHLLNFVWINEIFVIKNLLVFSKSPILQAKKQ
jgi:hypothetical protein